MCGIVGIVAPEVRRYTDALQRMVDRLSHRGPDGPGQYRFDNCALGHTRLSIVDLRCGQQPMLSPVAPVAITFNGEIYGYKPIRASLEANFPFRTTSDTEVMLALYERHGSQMLAHLPGQFAFALWDDAAQELLCARDRCGEKPFYYTFGPEGELIFASEIKALLASGLVAPVLNTDAVAHYLKYLYVHPHQTIYRNIYTLPPAHMLRYKNGKLAVERYWCLPPVNEQIGLSEATEQFRQLFDQAVARQLVADVPVGAFLSGGLDSTSVVVAASRHQARLQTFSFGFESAASELPFASEVARQYGTQHTELADDRADLAELLVTMQTVYDEPFADSSNIPTYLIARQARRHVKVVLTGDGGDELLGGYSWYKPLLHMRGRHADRAWWLFMLRAANQFATRLGHPDQRVLRERIGGMALRRRYRSVTAAHLGQRQYFGDADLARFGLPSPAAETFAPVRQETASLDDVLRMDLQDYMPGDILVKIDRASMAHGLELRAPFLDVDLLSFCVSLPYRLKITPREDKLILRRAFEASWPASVRARGKQGFGAPVQEWLTRPSVRALKQQYLDDPGQKLFGLLPFELTRAAAQRDDYRTWILLVLALWLDQHAVALS
ncbi:MAG TPA: asparagine synthase (glutamine-hydrolyzing) [Roseiflexaceae bacterium]|nr:asparagine synthase (glutamine-hydrolyzing) [Roseiflexaceae bacterium]